MCLRCLAGYSGKIEHARASTIRQDLRGRWRGARGARGGVGEGDGRKEEKEAEKDVDGPPTVAFPLQRRLTVRVAVGSAAGEKGAGGDAAVIDRVAPLDGPPLGRGIAAKQDEALLLQSDGGCSRKRTRGWRYKKRDGQRMALLGRRVAWGGCLKLRLR